MILSLLVLTAGLVAAQDTYSCPDGWMKEVNDAKLWKDKDDKKMTKKYTKTHFAK